MQLSMKNPICCTFGLYAAIMLQYAAAIGFFGISDNNCSFLLQNAPNNDFWPISYNFQWKIQYAAFLASMQQLCCNMQQLRLFFDEHPI